MNRVKNYVIVIIAIISFVSCISPCAVADDSETRGTDKIIEEKPEIYFEQQVYDFGKIYIGEKLEHVFKFKNAGHGVLVIDNVKSSCGCTAALVSKNKLIKDEEGQVEIKYNPGKYVGKVTKSVVVNSNDPKNQKIKLTITGEIIEEVVVNPKRLNFGIIRKGDTFTKEIEVKTVPELNVEVLKVESPNPYIIIKQDKNTKEYEYKYRVTINKYDYIGKFDGIIFIFTSSNKQERVDVPFYGEVVGDVTFYPEIISFGKTKKGQEAKKTVIINFVNKEIKIEKIEIEPNILNYQISEFNNNSKKIDIILCSNNTSGEIAGILKIYTNSIIQPVINVPIKGEISG